MRPIPAYFSMRSGRMPSEAKKTTFSALGLPAWPGGVPPGGAPAAGATGSTVMRARTARRTRDRERLTGHLRDEQDTRIGDVNGP